jgi:hypothetical protein
MSRIYKPNIEMFYGTVNDNDSKIIPAPNMSIGITYDYANDTIIGYTYNITLNGTITSLDLRNLAYGDEYDPTEYNHRNIGSLADSIDKTRFLLAQNGNVLHITDAATGTTFFKAKGGILRSFNVGESNNNWANSASFTATIDFNAIDINDVEDCYSSFLDITGFPTNDKGIVEINAYKLRSFSDSWSFSFEDETYDVNGQNEAGGYINLDNSHFKLSYQANATGKSYYVYSDDDTSASTLIPAWEQAKNFVQYRLYHQVTSLIDGVLKTYTSGCGSEDGLNDINIPGNTTSGLLSSLGDSNYSIFNEEISCDSSESQGTFSANYSCIVRRSTGGPYSPSNCFHTVQKSTNDNNSTGNTVRNINLTGKITGLMEGGIVRSNKPIELPAQGKLFIYNNMNGQEKINNALGLLNSIYFSNNNTRDFYDHFKTALNINFDGLQGLSNDPNPTSFNLTYNYLEGTIDYSVEYSSRNNCSTSYSLITVDIEDRTKVFVVLDIPGSNSCGVVQPLGTYTLKKVNVTIEGYNSANAIAPGQINLESLIDCANSCGETPSLPINIPGGTITDQTYTLDPFTGKYTINVSYMCPQDSICIA